MDLLETNEIIHEIYHLTRNEILKNEERHALMKKIYQLERHIFEIKDNYALPTIYPLFDSDSVIKSFNRKLPYFKDQNDLFVEDDKDKIRKSCVCKEYFRGIDYQYPLLVYLLLNHRDIIKNRILLYEIMEDFLEQIKNLLKYEDLIMTDSGAIRCRTNLRFTVDSLRKAGLINYYDENIKQSWNLTFLGFFIAASICIYPDPKRSHPLDLNITRIEASNFYFELDPFIKEKIQVLSDKNKFFEVVNFLSFNDIKHDELEKGPVIFKDYRQFLEVNYQKNIKKSEKIRLLKEFLTESNEKYNLKEYMYQLSTKYNLEKFVHDVKRKPDNDQPG